MSKVLIWMEQRTSAYRDIVTIGTSAGGFDALRKLAGRLPSDLPAAIVIVIHLASNFRSELDRLLSEAGPLPATFARDHEKIEQRHIYIAPPDRHLLIDDMHLIHGHGPRENNTRPAIDPLFRSVAICCAGRSIGVLLTGTLGDGSSGLLALKQAGGIVVVQDPKDAMFPEMPMRALELLDPDHVVKLAALPELLLQLTAAPAGTAQETERVVHHEVDVARTGKSGASLMDKLGTRSAFSCPDCGGAMWEIAQRDLVHFRCHVGHAYSAELMSLAFDENLREAFGASLRGLQEQAMLAEKLEKNAKNSGAPHLAQQWARKRWEAERQMEVIRSAVRRCEDIVAQAADEELKKTA